MKKLYPVLLAISLILAAPVFAGEAAPEEAGRLTKDIIILYTSDVHCGVDQNFGYVGLKAARDSLEAAGNYTILVDDGDSVQGDPLGTMTTGEANIELMNKVGYDIAIPGNHEFDYGMDRFLELTQMAEFPYISCNFNLKGELVFDPYVIKEFDGVKIAFVGVTTPNTLVSSTPRYFQDENGEYIYGFFQDATGEGVYNAVQTAVDDARAEGADYVVVMGHMGNEVACEPWTYADVITHTNGIDIFLDGHSHDLDQVVVKNKDGEDVLRSACGTKMECIGWARIPADPEESLSTGLFTYRNIISAPELLGIHNEISEAVDEARSELGEKLNEVVATSAIDLYIYDPEIADANGNPIRIIRRAETNLGDLCADAWLDQSGADIAFVNGGGIRANIRKGDITLGDILTVHPFGNAMCVAEVTGQQILDALEWGCHAIPDEFGGFMQVAGLTYEIHTYIDSPCTQDENSLFTGIAGEYRVKNVMVGGEPLDLEKTYTLACSNYVFKDMGDGYAMFKDCKLIQDEVKLDNLVLIDYITQTLGGEVSTGYEDPYGQGRIVAVEEPPAANAQTEAAVSKTDDAGKAEKTGTGKSEKAEEVEDIEDIEVEEAEDVEDDDEDEDAEVDSEEEEAEDADAEVDDAEEDSVEEEPAEEEKAAE